MVSISGFEASLDETDVVLAGFIGSVNSRFVDYAADVTITVEWALVLPSAVTCAGCSFWFRSQALEVVSTDNAFHIVHARIAYLHIVSVEQFMQFMVTWEMFVQDAKEAVGDISFNIHVEWGIEPHDVAFPLPFRLSWVFSVDIGHLAVVATIL